MAENAIPADGDLVIIKFRSIFPNKSRDVLSDIFSEMTNSVYQGKAKEDKKMDQAAKKRWGSVAAKFRSLNLIEFKIAMYRFRSAGLTFEEIRRVFLWLDESGNGRVEFDEFIAGIRGDLSLIRQRIVVFTFRKLDRNSSGFIEESELAMHLRRANIPDVIEGVATPQEIAKEFITLMGTPQNGTINPEGKISVEQMVDFYLTRSLEIPMTDDDFKAMVLTDWGMDAADGAGMPSHGVESSIHNRPVTPSMPSSPPPSFNTSPRSNKTSVQQVALVAQKAKEADLVAKQDDDRKAANATTSSAKDTEDAKDARDAKDTKDSKDTKEAVAQPAPVTAAAQSPSQQSVRRADSDLQVIASLQALVSSLQQKIAEHQHTMDSQTQIISTQQKMLQEMQQMMIISQQQK